MTEIEIEKQAEDYAVEKLGEQEHQVFKEGVASYIAWKTAEVEQAFQDGAKWGMEHAIEWHKAVERPKGYKQDFDVALKVLNYNTNQIEQDYGYYSVEYDMFYHSKSKFKIIAWCELPQYKE